MRDVYVIGSFSTPFGLFPEKTFHDLTRDSVLGALGDAGDERLGSQIESVWFGNVLMAYWGQHSTRGHFCLAPLIQEEILPQRVPITNVEGGCATGSMAFQGAWTDVLSGKHEVSMGIGVEKVHRPDISRAENLAMFRAGENSLSPESTRKEYERLAAHTGVPFVVGPDRSMFMDTYAAQATYHMQRFGTTQRQIASAAAKSHNYGALNPKAQYRFEMTVEDVLEDRVVSPPLTRSMCAPVGDGAAATIVCSEEFLMSLPRSTRKRAVRVAASTLTSGIYRDPDEPSLTRVAADRAYAQANMGPDEIHVAEVHDATSFGEIYQVEMLRFCEIGEGGLLAESGATGPGGSIPINTSGGLVSKGHPIGATGLSMLDELVIQLRGEAGERQVGGATRALLENGGGIMGLEEAACVVTILEAQGDRGS